MKFPGEKLLIRLSEIVGEKGIGGLLQPWQIRRVARAEAEARSDEMLLLAQAERDAEEIRSGRQDLGWSGRLLPSRTPSSNQSESGASSLDLGTVASAVERSMVADAIRREVNVAKALLLAEETLETEPEPPPDERPNDDWLFRWRDAASEVSEPELQRLWGRLLAGEIRSPGDFSLRTLECLRNLSIEDARAIAKLAPFVMNSSTPKPTPFDSATFVYSGARDLLADEGINLGFLLSMQSLGIIASLSRGMGMTLSGKGDLGFAIVLMSHGKCLIVTHEEASKTISVPAYPLTELGRQIVRLGSFEPNIPYLRKLGSKAAGDGFTVLLADVASVDADAGKITYDDENSEFIVAADPTGGLPEPASPEE